MVKEVEDLFQPLSDMTGTPTDQIVVVFCFIIALPLGWIHHYCISSALLRHLFSIVCGVAILLLQFELRGLIHFGLTSIIVYMMLLVLPQRHVAFPVLSFLLVYLSSMHIYRMVTDYMGWRMDATSVQMLMTCKLSLLAYSYQDTATIKEDPKRVPEEQKPFLINKLPNLLEYYSYILFYPSISVGPSFEYIEYHDFIHRKNAFRNIPSTFSRSFYIFGVALMFLALTAVGQVYFPHSLCYTDQFGEKTFWDRVFYFNVAMIVAKFRYTTAWKFTECSMISSGLGYTENSKTGNVWERAVSINWDKTEYAWTAKEMVENWNISVSIWLRRCIFNRILKAGKDPMKPSGMRKSIAQHASYMFSAFWHGFYPAYYLMFFCFSISTEISKMVFITDWSWLPGRNILKWVAWILMWNIGNYNGVIFLALDMGYALKFLKNIHYFPVILLAIGWTFFKITGLHHKPKPKTT
jgi:lysophospholipid acyltransferase